MLLVFPADAVIERRIFYPFIGYSVYFFFLKHFHQAPSSLTSKFPFKCLVARA